MANNLAALGVRLDGWADVVEGACDKAGEVRTALDRVVRAKELPDLRVGQSHMSPTLQSSRQRPYLMVEMDNGASLAVYIGALGRDLYVAWDAFLRPVFNMQMIYILLGGAAGLSFLGAINDRPGTSAIFGWVFGFIAWTLAGAFVLAIAGRVMRGSFLAFFFKQLDVFDADDIAGVMMAVHKAVLHALDAVGIQAQTLRLKEHFKAGAAERLI
jgi:hypothetical protein